VRNIKEKFIIILGYNQITSEIIKKAIEEEIRPVVIEKDENRASDLILENFTPSVPILVADVQNAKALEDAGITLNNCKAVVCLFEDETLNFRVALMCKLLNKNVTLAIKSTTDNHTENLKDLGVEIITDPFVTIATEINMAINAPNLLKLEKWIYGISDLNTALPKFPKGKYIVCGYGRMGYDIYKVLQNNDMEAEFIEHNAQKAQNFHDSQKHHIMIANADDKETLKNAGIEDAVGVIAATNDDTTNLSILTTARKLNTNIMTISRENELDDVSIFQNAPINHVFIPSNILINKTTNALINPLSEQFINELPLKDETWASKLVRKLVETIDETPLLYEVRIDTHDAIEIEEQLHNKKTILLNIFAHSLHNRELKNNVVPLLLVRDKQKMILPSWDEPLNVNDQILFACDAHAKSDMEYIAQNKYEFHYAYTGREKRTILSSFFKQKA
jgi:Trk K+ transport system NAD-binding subunit